MFISILAYIVLLIIMPHQFITNAASHKKLLTALVFELISLRYNNVRSPTSLKDYYRIFLSLVYWVMFSLINHLLNDSWHGFKILQNKVVLCPLFTGIHKLSQSQCPVFAKTGMKAFGSPFYYEGIWISFSHDVSECAHNFFTNTVPLLKGDYCARLCKLKASLPSKVAALLFAESFG